MDSDSNGQTHDLNGNIDEHTHPLIEQLREELKKTQEEKENLAAQHHNLVSKVANMRNTLGAKLKQDAVSSPLSSYTEPTQSHMHRKNSIARNNSFNNSQPNAMTSPKPSQFSSKNSKPPKRKSRIHIHSTLPCVIVCRT